MTLVEQARKLLLAHPEYLADARLGREVSNTIAGAVIAKTSGRPRAYCEQAVHIAVSHIDELILNQEARDQLVDDATHQAEDAFAQRGVQLGEAQMFALNDFITELLKEALR